MRGDEVSRAGFEWTFGTALLLGGACLIGLAAWVLEASVPCKGKCLAPFAAVVVFVLPAHYLGLSLITLGVSMIRGLSFVASLKVWAILLAVGTIVGIVVFVVLGSREPVLRG